MKKTLVFLIGSTILIACNELIPISKLISSNMTKEEAEQQATFSLKKELARLDKLEELISSIIFKNPYFYKYAEIYRRTHQVKIAGVVNYIQKRHELQKKSKRGEELSDKEKLSLQDKSRHKEFAQIFRRAKNFLKGIIHKGDGAKEEKDRMARLISNLEGTNGAIGILRGSRSPYNIARISINRILMGEHPEDSNSIIALLKKIHHKIKQAGNLEQLKAVLGRISGVISSIEAQIEENPYLRFKKGHSYKMEDQLGNLIKEGNNPDDITSIYVGKGKRRKIATSLNKTKKELQLLKRGIETRIQ